MKEKVHYTITILRNYGSPVSFTLERKKVWLALIALLSLSVLLVFMVSDYLVLSARQKTLRLSMQAQGKKIIALNHHLQEIEKARLAKANQSPLQDGSLEESLTQQEEVDTTGLWIGGGSESVKVESLDLEIPKTLVELHGDRLSIYVRIQNISVPPQDIGGYIFVSLINKDVAPITYTAVTGGKLGKDGFPESYKSGNQFFIGPNKFRKVALHYKLSTKEEFYTDMTIFLYSYRGTLLHKKTLPLDKKLFLE